MNREWEKKKKVKKWLTDACSLWCVSVSVVRVGIRGIWVRTTYYGLRLPSTRARTRELGGTTWHFGVEAYRCNPRWGSRTLGPPLAPERGTRPLLPNNRHHRSYIMHTFTPGHRDYRSLTCTRFTRNNKHYMGVRGRCWIKHSRKCTLESH